METEQMLLRHLYQGDTEALEALMDRYTPYVFAVLRRSLGEWARAEDLEELASNVFFSLWQHRKRLKTANLKGWLGKVAVNEARSWLRRQKLETVSSADWFELPDREAPRLEDAAERRALAAGALAVMDPEMKLYALDGHFQVCLTRPVERSIAPIFVSYVKLSE